MKSDIPYQFDAEWVAALKVSAAKNSNKQGEA